MREPDALDDAVARADLFRSRQAAFGAGRHPEALRFAASVVTAMAADARGAVGRPAAARHPRGGVRQRRPDRALQSGLPPPGGRRRRRRAVRNAPFQILAGPDRDARLAANRRKHGGSRRRPVRPARWRAGRRRAGRARRAREHGGARGPHLGRGAGAPGAARAPGASTSATGRARAERHVGGALPRRRARRGRPAARAASSASRPTRCGRRWRRARRAPTTTSSCTCPATCCCPAGPRSSGRADGTPMRVVGVVRDVSDAQRQAQRFADLMTVMPGGVAVLDPAGRIVSANPGLCALLGARAEQLRGMPAVAHWPPSRRRAGSRAGCGRCRRAPSTATASTPRRCCAPTAPPSGASWTWRAPTPTTAARSGSSWSPTSPSGDGWPSCCAAPGRIDELTRLPNRAACLELLDRLLAGPGRDRVAVVCGGLDDFQRINSSLGHDAGDDLLVTLAGRLQRDLPVSCSAGAPVRRRVRGDLRRPRRGGRPRPAREPGRRPAPHRDHRARQAGGHDGVGRPGHPGALRRRPRRRPAALRRGRDARRQAQAAPGRHRGGHRRRGELRHPRAGAGGGAAGRDRGRRARARVPAGGRAGRRGCCRWRRSCAGRTRSAG